MEERVITAVSPCEKFLNEYPVKQVMKIKEEAQEVFDAYSDLVESGEDLNCLVLLMMELLDVQASVNTMFMILERDYGKIDYTKCRVEAERKVINKNLARGYYAYENTETD